MTTFESTQGQARRTRRTIPFFEDTATYKAGEQPQLREGVIVHFQITHHVFKTPTMEDCFTLLKTIGKHRYNFSLSGGILSDGEFSLHVETEGYRYAMTNLTPPEREAVFTILADFVESFTDYKPVNIETIESNSSLVSYSVKDIDECVQKILAHPNNTSDEVTLRKITAKSVSELFDRYYTLYGQYIHGRHHADKNHMRGRTRLFAKKYKKYLKHWKVVEDPDLYGVVLERKT
jgi:hypothetical protein